MTSVRKIRKYLIGSPGGNGRMKATGGRIEKRGNGCARRSCSSSEEQWADQLRGQQRIKKTSTQTVRGDLLHHQNSCAMLFYITNTRWWNFFLYRILLDAIQGCSNLGLAQSGCV